MRLTGGFWPVLSLGYDMIFRLFIHLSCIVAFSTGGNISICNAFSLAHVPKLGDKVIVESIAILSFPETVNGRSSICKFGFNPFSIFGSEYVPRVNGGR